MGTMKSSFFVPVIIHIHRSWSVATRRPETGVETRKEEGF